MTQPAPDPSPSEPQGPPPLRTEPRPLVVHWLVDGAVVFVATILLALFFGLPWVGVLVASFVVGGAVAPFTRRADERAMLARRAR